MKTILKTISLVLVCLGITACDNHVGDIDPGPAGNPEKEIAGTYTGTLTAVNTSTNAEESGASTITFTPGDKAYITDVKVECPTLGIDLQSIANVVNFSEGYLYYNRESKNGFGVTFDGRVVKDEATIKFTISKKVGLKQTIYNYTFTGVKN